MLEKNIMESEVGVSVTVNVVSHLIPLKFK